jgi:hypothetical protein
LLVPYINGLFRKWIHSRHHSIALLNFFQRFGFVKQQDTLHFLYRCPQHNLCVDILYVTDLKRVPAFWPSSGIIHTPLSYLLFSLYRIVCLYIDRVDRTK